MKRVLSCLIIVVATLCCCHAKQFNDKLLNRPYADLKAWHLGFSVGMHMQDLKFTHNGYVTDDGRTWFAQQSAYSPGFCVNGLIDFRLSTWFNVRLAPGLWFGNKVIDFYDTTLGGTERQNIKQTMIVLPVDFKYSSLRYHNVRPYVSAGLMPTFDVNKQRSSDLLQLNKFDCYLTIGLGCDIYRPYFKFLPEIKFCYGLTDALRSKRPDLADDPGSYNFTRSLKRATSKMFVFTFYFE